MVGQISYTTEQILFVLEQVLADKKRDIILYEYQKKFSKSLSASQLRYIKNKYGHDPEFGTALVNRELPENSGNRRMANLPPKGQPIQYVHPGNETSSPPVIHMPQPYSNFSKSLSMEHQKLQCLADNTCKSSQKSKKSLIWPSWEKRTQPRPQLQLQHAKLLQHQARASAPEPSGTYWFDQYAPTAYETPYGYQPVLHYNNRLLYPSTTQNGQLEEPVEMVLSSEARQMLPTNGLNDPPSLPDTASEPMDEPKAKRSRLELPEGDFAQIRTAKSAQMSMEDLAHQTMNQGNPNFCDVAPFGEPAAPIDTDKAHDALYPDDDKNEPFPWSQFIREVGHETLKPEDSLPLPSPLQMPRIWNGNSYVNSTSTQEPTSVAASLSTATHPTTISADTNITSLVAAWDQPSNEMELGLQSNYQANSSFHSSQLLEAYHTALDPASGPGFGDALQTLVGCSIVEIDPSGDGGDGDNQEQSSSGIMAVPEQAGFSDGLDFLGGLNYFANDIDWSVDPLIGDDLLPGAYLTPGVDLAQGVDGQIQSSHLE